MKEGKSAYAFGYWSSVFFALTGVLYGVSMGILLSLYAVPEYRNIEQFVGEADKQFMDLYAFGQLFAFVSAILFIVVLCSVHECVKPVYRIFSRLSLCFGLAFALLACLNYYIQFSIVRLSLNDGVTRNLENLVQFNPRSFAFALNMLGWSLFLGLSALFLGLLFKGKGIHRAIRLSFYATSFCCLLGFAGSVIDSSFLMLIFQMGMTAGLTVGAVVLAVAFKRSRRESTGVNEPKPA